MSLNYEPMPADPIPLSYEREQPWQFRPWVKLTLWTAVLLLAAPGGLRVPPARPKTGSAKNQDHREAAKLAKEDANDQDGTAHRIRGGTGILPVSVYPRGWPVLRTKGTSASDLSAAPIERGIRPPHVPGATRPKPRQAKLSTRGETGTQT